MMNKMKLSSELQSKLWNAFNVLRGELDTSSYIVAPCTLVLCRLGFTPYEILQAKNNGLSSCLEIVAKGTGLINLDKEFYEAIGEFEREFKILNDSKLLDLIDAFNEPTIKNLSNEEAGLAYGFCLDLVFSNFTNNSGEILQPIELSALIASIYSPEQGSKVFNPFAKTFNFAPFLPKGITYFGQEQYLRAWALGKLRLVVNGINEGVQLIKGNSTTEWVEGINFDYIFSFPPIMLKGSGYGINRYSTGNYVDSNLIEKSLSYIERGCKFISVVPKAFLSRSSNFRLREHLVEKDLIEFVIDFPGGILPNTSIPFSIVGLNKNKPTKGNILFYNAENSVAFDTKKKGIIDVEAILKVIQGRDKSADAVYVDKYTISNQEYNLNTKRYLSFGEETLISDEIVFLKDILIPISAKAVKDEFLKGKYIRIRDLKDNDLEFEIDLESLSPDTDIPKQAYEVSEEALLLALRWDKLKPTWVAGASESSVYVSSDIAAFKVASSDIDKAYLIAELNSEFVQKQATAYRTGDTVPAISKRDLAKMKIRLPNLAAQRDKVIELREAAIKQKEEELQSLKEKLGGESFQQLTTLKHSLGTPLGSLVSGLRSIKRFINQQSEKGNVTSLATVINERFSYTVGDTLEELIKNTRFMSDLLNQNENDLIVENYRLEVLDVVGFIKDYVTNNQFNDWNFKLTSNNTGEIDAAWRRGVHIKANQHLLRVLLNNMMDNANRHAFRGGSKETNKVRIHTAIGPDLEYDPCVLIFISNNGKPFPENFDLSKFIRKNVKAGETGNTGIGGFEINKIVTHFNGGLELNTGDKGEYITTFAISIPLFTDSETEEIIDENL